MWGNTSIFIAPPSVSALYRAPMALRLQKGLQKSRPAFVGEATSMLRSATALVGFTIGASDGDIGEVEALYFDDQQWTIRYLVVDTGRWLGRPRALVSPVCVRRPPWPERRLPIALTMAQLKAG